MVGAHFRRVLAAATVCVQPQVLDSRAKSSLLALPVNDSRKVLHAPSGASPSQGAWRERPSSTDIEFGEARICIFRAPFVCRPIADVFPLGQPKQYQTNGFGKCLCYKTVLMNERPYLNVTVLYCILALRESPTAPRGCKSQHPVTWGFCLSRSMKNYSSAR